MLRSLVPKSLSASARSSKRLAMEFCDEAGLVYFGHVSQRDDEHHIVRGVTVSNQHVDNHYCIGTYDGYDVIFVERSDTLSSGKKHIWHIIEIDLKTTVDIPHMFVSSHAKATGFHELLKAKYHTMLAHAMGSIQPYPSGFTSGFNVNVTPTHAVTAEKLISPDTAGKIAAHFKGLTVEITHEAIYLYSEKAHVTQAVLMAMLTNGVWLASQIDKNSRQLI